MTYFGQNEALCEIPSYFQVCLHWRYHPSSPFPGRISSPPPSWCPPQRSPSPWWRGARRRWTRGCCGTSCYDTCGLLYSERDLSPLYGQQPRPRHPCHHQLQTRSPHTRQARWRLLPLLECLEQRRHNHPRPPPPRCCFPGYTDCSCCWTPWLCWLAELTSRSPWLSSSLTH